jgi:hypothetical protein
MLVFISPPYVKGQGFEAGLAGLLTEAKSVFRTIHAAAATDSQTELSAFRDKIRFERFHKLYSVIPSVPYSAQPANGWYR